MTNDTDLSLEQIHDNLDIAIEEFRTGSISDALNMMEITRDQLAAVIDGPTADPLEEDTEE